MAKKQGTKVRTASTVKKKAIAKKSGNSDPEKAEKKGPGRPKGSTNKPKPEEKHVGMDTILQIPLTEIKLDNESFMFRTKLRVNGLVKSIGNEGLQVPVIVRSLKDSDSFEESGFKYQLISGFRRVTAIKELGWKKVDAIVRSDLDDDFDAFKVSIIENEDRKTYNDLDRANAILAFRKLGKSNKEIEDFFNIGERQRQRLQELTKLPPELQEAVEDGLILSTHAVRLMQHKRKYPDTNIASWVKQIKEENLAMNELNKRLKAEAQEEDGKKTVELFVENKEKGKKPTYRIRPISISENTSEGDLKEIKKQITKLTKFVDALLKK